MNTGGRLVMVVNCDALVNSLPEFFIKMFC